MPAVRLEISGRVQGVGYRYWLKETAENLALTGWVRNLPDGKVAAELCGTKEKIDKCQDLCWTGPAAASVTAVHRSDIDKIDDKTDDNREKTSPAENFKILY